MNEASLLRTSHTTMIMRLLLPMAGLRACLLLSIWWLSLSLDHVAAEARASQRVFQEQDRSDEAAAIPACYPFCGHDEYGSQGQGTPAVASDLARAHAPHLGNLRFVDPRIGTSGPDESEYGGMVPSVSRPFAGVRWTPMTRLNNGQFPPSLSDDCIPLVLFWYSSDSMWLTAKQ